MYASSFLAGRGFHDGGKLRLIRQDDTGRFRRGHDHEAVSLRKPVARQRIDLGERDCGKEPPVEREFLPDRRQRFALEEVARVLVGPALRFAVGAFRHRALEAPHRRLLRAGELRGGESKACDPLQLGDERLEAACHAVVRDERLEHRLVPGPGGLEQPSIRRRAQERRICALGQFAKPVVEHAGKQLVDHQLAISADRSLIARGAQVAELHRRRRRFAVADNRVARGRMFGDVEHRPRTLRRW